MSFFIPNAYAAGAESMAAGSGYGSLILLIGFVLIFYFLLWRPQSKRAKEHRELVANLSKGDEVVTNGGIIGKIVKVDEDIITLAIADGVEIKVQKPAISAALPKGTMNAK